MLLVFFDSSMVLHNPLDRPMRTRMSGGVAGEGERPAPPMPIARVFERYEDFRLLAVIVRTEFVTIPRI